ncbi:anion permease [Secundilactobacillus collinoides]|uniref:Di-and tricarboxylate transporter n=2 Tax=Secundilactobacillus collinoides TaxID=33960 RepID=A0A0R2BBK0_SECCO|nr:di- and tricarboxylate transporter [Secundilactobacillus collinoides DSM 20515 = JCM 1123]KZL42825.1 2-oxoglutarate translocator [Secundilactobacillus collinoides]
MKMSSGVKYRKLILPFLIGIVIWGMTPIRPTSISVAGWHILAIFIATIIGCITRPMPIGAVAIVGFTITVLTKTVSTDVALTGFGNATIWLIVMAFFISRGFIKTGLGRRIALNFASAFGKHTLGLAYSLIAVDLVLSPAMPSSTARAGGVVYPIIDALSNAFGSSPKQHTQRKIGSFLVFSEFHGNIITSAMFLTSMAGNPLAQLLAKSQGIKITWMGWLMASIVPGIVSLTLIPYLIYKLYPPELKEMPDVKPWAQKQLAEMGKISIQEKLMSGIFILALALWTTESLTGIDATMTAFIALALILLTGVLSWDDVLHETGAWNTFTWFSVLVMMADQLNQKGFIPWLSKTIAASLHGMNWMLVLTIACLAYFYSHYLFASATAHISAMYLAFLGIAISSGVPGMLAALMLGFFSNIFGSTTHYGYGPAPVLFGSGYVTQNEWWRLNAILGVVYIVIWLGLGTLWMKVIGFW